MRVLIVNLCGLLAALPTEQEFRELEFITEGNQRVLGLVECSPEDAALIYKERARVRVLAPGLPEAGAAFGEWLYVAVVQGRVVLVNPT